MQSDICLGKFSQDIIEHWFGLNCFLFFFFLLKKSEGLVLHVKEQEVQGI